MCQVLPHSVGKERIIDRDAQMVCEAKSKMSEISDESFSLNITHM